MDQHNKRRAVEKKRELKRGEGEKGWLERRGEEGFARGFAVDRRRSSPVASTTPLLSPKAFPLTRNDLSSLPRSENTDQGRGREKEMFLLKRRIQRAVGRISTWYNAMPWRTSLPPCLPVSNLSNE